MDEAFRGPDYRAGDPGSFTQGSVFVIMAMSPEMDATFRAISEVCDSVGLFSRRADEGVGSPIVLRDICESIEQAEFLVVDLTHERPNVYYELGYAHGVGNESAEILLLAREGTTLHFDIAPLRVRYYASEDDLRDIVRRNLQRMISATRR
jgi:hypothetical protein